MNEQKIIDANYVIRTVMAVKNIDDNLVEILKNFVVDLMNECPAVNPESLLTVKDLRKKLEQSNKEKNILMEAVRGDCSYCKYEKLFGSDDAPCWHCSGYAAREYITGDYWQLRTLEEK